MSRRLNKADARTMVADWRQRMQTAASQSATVRDELPSVIARARGVLTLTEIAKLAGVSRATIHRCKR